MTEPSASARPINWHESCVCGHELADHEAGECWATYAGQQCGCSWYTAKSAVGGD